MATNSKALSSIEKIKKAFAKYGSTITIKGNSVDAVYDSYGNITTPAVTNPDEITKGIVETEATISVSDAFSKTNNGNYELAIKIYSPNVITKANTLVYDGNTYEIIFVSKKSLQDTLILYELLVRK